MRLVGLGIDLVALSRVKQFLKDHKRRAMDRLLTLSEKKQFSKKSPHVLTFSKIFAAKEAFFKAMGKPWMGLDGFKAIHVKLLPHGKFQVESLHFEGRSPLAATGSFFQCEGLVGAEVILWS